jgi:long-subunit acyl-CoA synthetase (AMP-forming)
VLSQQATISGRSATTESLLQYLEYCLAYKLVLSKVHDALGLADAKYFVSGAAPLTTEAWTYFASLGIPVMDIYGMSECTGPQVDVAVAVDDDDDDDDDF